MKILMVNKFLHPNGGSETYIFNLAKQLEALGHEVQFFGMEHRDRVVSNSLGIYTNNMDFRGSSRGYKQAIKKLSYPFKIIYSIEAKKKILKILEDMQPDVVHLNNINFQLTPSIIRAIIKYSSKNMIKTKIVYTAHDYQWICPNHMLYVHDKVCEKCINGCFINCARNKCIHGSFLKSCIGSLEGYFYTLNRVYEAVDTIIAPSNFMKEMLGHRWKLKSKIVVLQNFVDSIECNNDAKDIDKYILYIGRLDYEKGIDLIINAALSLPHIQFIIAGNGQMVDGVKNIKNIEYLGFVTGEKLTQLIRSAAFTVYPARWYENCPFSIMESISIGTPVLASSIGGIPELVIDKFNGELFNAGDQDDFNKHVEKIWNDKNILDYYRNNCRNHNFMNIQEYVERLLEIYQ